MLFATCPRCPHCSTAVTPAGLRRIPFAGSRRWYQFTPSPSFACPACNGRVRATASDSPWLWLVVMPLLAPLAIAHIPPLAFLAHGAWLALWIAPAALGLYLLARSNRLVADMRADAA